MIPMPDKTKTYQLIVRQTHAADPELDDLLRILQREHGLDAYTARQRLIGPGLVMLGKGGFEKTGKIANLLRQHGFCCWQIVPSAPVVKPSRLLALEIQQEYIQFESQDGPVRLLRGTGVVAVLADLSGGLIDKYVKRIIAQNTYRGRNAVDPLAGEAMMPTILNGKPVLDFYLLDSQGQVQSAVRVLPGRFNPAGLGERATMSSRGNLEAMLVLIKEYAQPLRLHYDFGLSQLPKCQVQRLEDGSSALESNFKSLHHYGWLLTQLRGDVGPAALGDTQVGGIAAAVVSGQTALASVLGADGLATTAPGLAEVSQEIGEALRDQEQAHTSTKERAKPAVAKDLPPPPDMPDKSMNLNRFLPLIFGGAVGVAVLVSSGGDELFRWLVKYSMAAGVVPAMVAALLLWGGFYFIRLKRCIENTPTSKIRSIAMGMVEVHGRANRLYALVAPMTQSACVWYRLRKYSRDRNEKWRLVREVNSGHVPFQVDDGTGKVSINPVGASIKAKVRQVGYPGQSLLTFNAFGGSISDDEKWVEDVIYEGTSLYVLGYAQPQRQEKISLRERTVAKLRQLKLDHQAMRRYDTNGDGQVDQTEWEAARSDIEQQALQESLQEQGVSKRQEEHAIIVKPPQSRLPFIIAETGSEDHLTSKYGWTSLPLLAAGVAALALAVYKFIQFVKV